MQVFFDYLPAVTQGQTLNASSVIADADGMGAISYQWLAAGVNIGGATSSSFTLTEAQVGKAITVVASYVDGHGTLESVTSTPTTAVVNVNDTPTGSVVISGTATQGQTLTAINTLADADGMGVISYQWLADGAAIDGGTGSTITLAQAQVGKAITVVASYTDGHGTAESLRSAATASVQAPARLIVEASALTVNEGDSITFTISPSWVGLGPRIFYEISGISPSDLQNGIGDYSVQTSGALVGVNNGVNDYVNANSSTPGKLTLQVAADYLTEGDETLTLMFADGQDGVWVSVVVKDTSLTPSTVTIIEPNHSPTGTVAIAGAYIQGQTLTATNTLTDADGMGAISYQWLADGAAIGGGTGSTLNLAQAQVGKAISVAASYVDGHGMAETTGSHATIPVVSDVGVTLLTGTEGADNLTGGPGKDFILALGGIDTLVGGAGDDTLVGGLGGDAGNGVGADHLTGGEGIDTFIVSTGYAIITDFNFGADKLQVGAGARADITLGADWTAVAPDTQVAGMLILSTAGRSADLSAVSGGTFYLYNNSGQAAVLTGSRFNDTVQGGSGNDILSGGAGDDTLMGNYGDDVLKGGAGNDTVDDGPGSDTIEGGSGADNFLVYAIYDNRHWNWPNSTSTDTIMDLGDGADVLVVNSYPEENTGQIPWGPTVNATVVAAWTATAATHHYASGYGNQYTGSVNLGSAGFAVDLSAVINGNSGFAVTNTGAATTLTGSSFSDTLIGGAGDDTLVGGLGNDTLNGGVGNDSLTGGDGSDRFLVSFGLDVITDFEAGAGKDVLDFSNLLRSIAGYDGSDPFAAGYLKLTQSGADTLLSFDADGSAGTAQAPATIAVLQNVTATDLVPASLTYTFP